MTRRQAVKALAVAAVSAVVCIIAAAHYNAVVDNSRASGLAMVLFVAGWGGGIFGFGASSSYLMNGWLTRRDLRRVAAYHAELRRQRLARFDEVYARLEAADEPQWRPDA